MPFLRPSSGRGTPLRSKSRWSAIGSRIGTGRANHERDHGGPGNIHPVRGRLVREQPERNVGNWLRDGPGASGHFDWTGYRIDPVRSARSPTLAVRQGSPRAFAGSTDQSNRTNGSPIPYEPPSPTASTSLLAPAMICPVRSVWPCMRITSRHCFSAKVRLQNQQTA